MCLIQDFAFIGYQGLNCVWGSSLERQRALNAHELVRGTYSTHQLAADNLGCHRSILGERDSQRDCPKQQHSCEPTSSDMGLFNGLSGTSGFIFRTCYCSPVPPFMVMMSSSVAVPMVERARFLASTRNWDVGFVLLKPTWNVEVEALGTYPLVQSALH